MLSAVSRFLVATTVICTTGATALLGAGGAAVGGSLVAVFSPGRGPAAAAEQDAPDYPTVVLRPGPVNGAPPARGYVIGKVFHGPNGTVTLPHEYGLGVVGTHLIGTRDFTQTEVATVEVLDAAGAVVLSRRLRWGFAISDDHTVAAWAGPRGRIHTWTEADGVVRLAAQRRGAVVKDVNGSTTCREAAGGACTVYFDMRSFEIRPRFITSDGTTGIVAPDAVAFADATDGGRLAYFTSIRDDGTCSRVKPGFRTCRHSFGRFSDNGRRIIGYNDRRDGIGDGFADVLNSRTARIQVRAEVPLNGYIGQVLWEDNDSVVVNAWVNGRAQLYRINASGTWERVARALRSADVDNPYSLVE